MPEAKQVNKQEAEGGGLLGGGGGGGGRALDTKTPMVVQPLHVTVSVRWLQASDARRVECSTVLRFDEADRQPAEVRPKLHHIETIIQLPSGDAGITGITSPRCNLS